MTDESRPVEEEVEEIVEEPAAEPAPDDSYLRLAADFDNYRKRVAREHAELTARANERLVNELLPVLDDLERALEAAAEHEEAKLEEGVQLVHRSLASLLERHGLTEIGTEGAFDPHVHEALQEASRSLADAIYAQATAQAASQASGNGGAAEDEVVEDADFEVIDEEEATKS